MTPTPLPVLRRPLRPLLAALGLLAACGAALVACGSAPAASGGTRAASTSAPVLTSARYTLGDGESVALTPQMTLKLERINDSRCKKAAVCVWEGHISYTFLLSTKSGATPIVLSDSMPNAAPTAVRHGLRFTLAGVEPATPPALDAPVPLYRVTLQVDVMPTTGRP